MKKYILLLIFTVLPHAVHGMIDNAVGTTLSSHNHTFNTEKDGKREYKITILDYNKKELGWVDCSIKKANSAQGLIIHIFIEEPFRQKGLASHLLTKTFDLLKSKGCNEIELDVAQANEPSQQLFRKHGFTHVSLDDDDFFLPGDVFTFRKKL